MWFILILESIVVASYVSWMHLPEVIFFIIERLVSSWHRGWGSCCYTNV